MSAMSSGKVAGPLAQKFILIVRQMLKAEISGFKTGWESGLLPAFFHSFGDILTDEKANEAAQEFIRDRIREIIKTNKPRGLAPE